MTSARRSRLKRSTRNKVSAFVLPKPPPFVQRIDYTELQASTLSTGRVYDTPAGGFASITTLLGKTQDPEKAQALAQWREAVGAEQAQETLDESSEYGTLVHDTMEAYLRHEAIDASKLHPLAKRAVKELCQLLKGRFEQTWALEVPLYSPTLRIAGRTDVVGVWQGKPVILDYKTARTPKKREDITDYFVQLLFYALAHNEVYGTNIRHGVIAMAVMTGEPQVFEVDLWDLELWQKFEDKLVSFHGEYFDD